MGTDEDWLLVQGFVVEVEEDEADEYWTHLVHKDNPSGRVPNYGRGPTPEDSVRSARRRYEVEQLGMDSDTPYSAP